MFPGPDVVHGQSRTWSVARILTSERSIWDSAQRGCEEMQDALFRASKSAVFGRYDGPTGRPFVVTANVRPFRPFGYGGHFSRADGPGYLNGWAFGPNRNNSLKNASQRCPTGFHITSASLSCQHRKLWNPDWGSVKSPFYYLGCAARRRPQALL